MKPLNISIRAIGPGSQPSGDEELQCVPMPRDVTTFAMPRLPESADAEHTAGARAVLVELLDRLKPSLRAGAGRNDGDGAVRIDVTQLAAGSAEVLNQTLGEGEVGVRIAGKREIHIQESVFAGVWREHHLDAAGNVVLDHVVACGIPPVAVERARAEGAVSIPEVEVPPGAMNSPALLQELRACLRARRSGDPSHVINLTLLPLTPDDHTVLDSALGTGPVAIISRGFGNCRITATAVRDVWRVQYFNSMNTPILNTLEVVEIPEVALAAVEDLADSAERLQELVEWMGESEVRDQGSRIGGI